MKQFKIPIISFVFLLSLLCLLLFRTEASGSLWKGFKVLVVSSDNTELTVLELLEKAGINKVITQSGNDIEAKHPLSPVQLSDSGFDSRRALWFMNQTGTYRYFYLRDTPSLVNKVHKAFSGSDFFWYLEDYRSFSFLPMLPSVLMIIAGFFIGKKQIFRFFASLPYLLLSLSCNTTVGALCSLYALFSLQLLSALLDTGFFELNNVQLRYKLISKPWYLTGALAAFILAAVSGTTPLILFLAATFATVALILLYAPLQTRLAAYLAHFMPHRTHPRFRPVPILHQSLLTPIALKSFCISASTLIIAAVVVFIPVSRTGQGTGLPSDRDLSIPAPSGYTASGNYSASDCSELLVKKQQTAPTNLADYIGRQWTIRTFPFVPVYRQSANSAPQSGDVIEVTEYRSADNGALIPKVEQQLIFNDNFVRKVLDRDELPPLEQLLLAQGRFVSVSAGGTPLQLAPQTESEATLFLLFLLFPLAGIIVRLKK